MNYEFATVITTLNYDSKEVTFYAKGEPTTEKIEDYLKSQGHYRVQNITIVDFESVKEKIEALENSDNCYKVFEA